LHRQFYPRKLLRSLIHNHFQWALFTITSSCLLTHFSPLLPARSSKAQYPFERRSLFSTSVIAIYAGKSVTKNTSRSVAYFSHDNITHFSHQSKEMVKQINLHIDFPTLHPKFHACIYPLLGNLCGRFHREFPNPDVDELPRTAFFYGVDHSA